MENTHRPTKTIVTTSEKFEEILHIGHVLNVEKISSGLQNDGAYNYTHAEALANSPAALAALEVLGDDIVALRERENITVREVDMNTRVLFTVYLTPVRFDHMNNRVVYSIYAYESHALVKVSTTTVIPQDSETERIVFAATGDASKPLKLVKVPNRTARDAQVTFVGRDGDTAYSFSDWKYELREDLYPNLERVIGKPWDCFEKVHPLFVTEGESPGVLLLDV